MVPISPTSVAYWTYTGLSSLYYGWQVHKYRREDRRERQELQNELASLEVNITNAQNRVFDTPGWEANWKALDSTRRCLYSLANEAEKVPYRGMSWKELAFDYREKLEECDVVKKSLPPLREALRKVGSATKPTEIAAIAAYVRHLEEGLRDKYAGAEEYLQMFEREFDGTKLAEKSKANRAKRFAAEHGQISADADVIAYISASSAKVYKNPPDWAPFPKGRYFGPLRPKAPKNKKGRTTMRCGRFGIDRVVFTWDYNDVPKPTEIAAEASTAARWGWFKVSCIVGNRFDRNFKNFVKKFASPGTLLYAHELNSGETIHDRNAVSPAFLGYFEPNGRPQHFREYMIELSSKKDGLDAATLRSLGFRKRDVAGLEKKDLLYEICFDQWNVNTI